MITGTCQYLYNPSELYQRTKPGQGIETQCGGRTWPAQDEPELGMVRLGDGTVEYRPTGRMVERSHPDPYCPAHGGSAEPPPPPVSQAELAAAYERYAEFLARFRAQQAAALAAAPPVLGIPADLPPDLMPAQLTAEQVTDAARAYLSLTGAAAAQAPPGPAAAAAAAVPALTVREG